MSSNPVFKTFNDTDMILTDKPMTISGTINKLLLLSLILMAGAGLVYYQSILKHTDFVNILSLVGIIGSVILGFIIPFKANLAPTLAPVYALFEGFFISSVSIYVNDYVGGGIVIQAAAITILTVLVMAVLYKMNLIRATQMFKSVVIMATFSICIFYLISMILMFFNINVPYFSENSQTSIIVNALIALVAALNLIIDFDFIENGAKRMYPSQYEWYGAYGLLVTIVWLYIEILKLLARSRKR